MKKILNYILGFLILLLLLLFFVKRLVSPTIETLKNKKNYTHKTNNLYDDFLCHHLRRTCLFKMTKIIVK